MTKLHWAVLTCVVATVLCTIAIISTINDRFDDLLDAKRHIYEIERSVLGLRQDFRVHSEQLIEHDTKPEWWERAGR